MAYTRTHWRALDAWKEEGFDFSTASNEAVKMYDAAITQIVGRYDEDSVGGLEKTINSILQSDPNFVMGHVLYNGLVSRNKEGIDQLMNLISKNNIPNREKLHALAIKELYNGNGDKACLVWEEILLNYPTDIFALKMAQETYIYLGQMPQMRDSVARVLPSWKPQNPLYSYIHGLYAFGLEETGNYSEAEKHAKLGLELNPYDCGATHAMAHVFEMLGKPDEGIKFMKQAEPYWNAGQWSSGHNFLHLALYHVEKGEFEAALDIYDNELEPRLEKLGNSTVYLSSPASLLFRLELEGINVVDRWKTLSRYWESHIEDHITIHDDIHMLMCTLGAKRQVMTTQVLQSLKNYIRDGSGTNCEVSREIGIPICEALVLADKGQYDEVVEILKPIRYDLVKIGGSNAQRDAFNVFLINAAIMSPRKNHQNFARRLLAERQALREKSLLTDRLVGKAMGNHDGCHEQVHTRLTE